MKAKFKKRHLLSLLLISSLSLSLFSCSPGECTEHTDKNDDALCDTKDCSEAYTDGCDTKACLDTDGDGKCDNEGCDKATDNVPEACTHTDKDDDGKCDECSLDFTDGCDKNHTDVNDDGLCDFGEEAFTDGCDTKACLDTDGDGRCDNEGCDKATENKPADEKVTLTIKVVDGEGNAITGAKVQICKEGESCQKPVSLDENGTASFSVVPGVYYATLSSLPDGYTEEVMGAKYYFGSSTEITVTLTKEEATALDYKVTVVDAAGTPVSDIIVYLKKDGAQVGFNVALGNTLVFNLPTDTYSVELEFTGTEYFYEKSKCVLTPTESELTVTLYLAPTEKDVVYAVPKDGSDHKPYNAYYLNEGTAYVTIKADEMTYFLFRPQRGGVYEFYADTALELYTGFYGNPLAALAFNSAEVDESGKKAILNVRDSSVGGEFLIGVRSDEKKAVNCVFTIDRVSDPIRTPEDEPYQQVTTKLNLVPLVLGGEGQTVSVTNIDITEKVTVVLNSSDGYYHLGDENGPIVYVRITTKSSYIDSFSTICETSAMRCYFYDEDGNFVKKELYNVLISEYAAVADEKTGLYPLTEEMATAIRNHGNHVGWWRAAEANYIFTGTPIDVESAWLFACATVEITETNDTTEPEAPDEPTEPEAPEVQKGYNVGNAAYTSEVALYNGEVYNTAEADGKILVINFWAAWCNPCKSELPDFDKVATEYKDSVTVLAIHLYDTRIDGESYVAQNFAETDILFGYDEVDDAFYYQLGGPGTIPMTIIIDENGIITNRFEAKISEATLKAAIDAILTD